MLYDQLATLAEQHDILARKNEEVPKFQQWTETLDHPPVDRLSDRRAVGEVLQRALLGYLRDERQVIEVYQAGTGQAAVDDDVPAGWDDATLLAEMQASRRAEMRHE